MKASVTLPATTDVLIVGGGPVGMFCALELLAHGVEDIVVLESDTAQDERLRARVSNSMTVALLERRGLLDELKPSEPRGIVHFGGFEKVDLSQIDADHPYGLFVRQQTIAAAFERRLNQLSHPVARGQMVTSLTPGTEQVSVEVQDRSTGESTHITARYLLACDGGRSFVRRELGIPYDGNKPTFVAYQGLMDISIPKPLDDGWYRSTNGMFIVGPGRRVMVADLSGDPTVRIEDEDELHEEFRTAVARVVGVDVEVNSIDTLTRFTDNARIARRFREGNIFLVGDAAHVQPPWAGQGLNMGLQDAANLSWKLADVLTGLAPEALLDTYDAERRWISVETVQLALGQVALMRPSAEIEALRQTISRLLDEPGFNKAIANRIAGVTVHYQTDLKCACVGRFARNEPLQLLDKAKTSTTLVELQRDRPDAHLVVAGCLVDEEPPHLLQTWSNCVQTRSLATDDGHASRIRVIRPDGYVSDCLDAHSPSSSPYEGLLARHHPLEQRDLLATPVDPLATGASPRYERDM